MTTDEKIARELAQKSDIAKLMHQFSGGAISRREFTLRLLSLGIAAGMAGQIIGNPRLAAATTPKVGGRIRAAAGQHGPKDTLDPAKFTNSTDYCRGEQFYNGLTRINASLGAEPELAESWEAEAGAKAWVFNLRKGVEFHNGKPLTTKDVIYSIQRHFDEAVGSKAKGFMKQIEEVKAEGPHTVRFTLSGANADFPIVLGLFHMKIIPENYDDFSTAVGTGPYTVKEFTPGVRSIGVRNQNYWSDGPYIDEIEWFGIGDPVARVSALLAGDIQMMTGIDPEAVKRVDETPGVSAVNTPAGQFADFAMMIDREPMNNPDLRLAIKNMFDREAIVNRLYKGSGIVGNDQPIPPMDPYYCDDVKPRPLDLDKAKFHLKKADMIGATIELHTSVAASSGAVEQALILQQQASKAGLTIDVKRDPADGYWSNIWGKKSFYMSGWNMRPTTDIMLTLAFKSGAGYNEAKWGSERFDEILELGRAELDPVKRMTYYCEAQHLISDTGGVAIPAFFGYLDAMSDKIKGFQPVPLGPLAAGQWPKHVWLDS